MELLKELSHEHIVKYIGFLKTKEFMYIILEFVKFSWPQAASDSGRKIQALREWVPGANRKKIWQSPRDTRGHLYSTGDFWAIGLAHRHDLYLNLKVLTGLAFLHEQGVIHRSNFHPSTEIQSVYISLSHSETSKVQTS